MRRDDDHDVRPVDEAIQLDRLALDTSLVPESRHLGVVVAHLGATPGKSGENLPGRRVPSVTDVRLEGDPDHADAGAAESPCFGR